MQTSPAMLPAPVQLALQRGEKIEAIKLLREHWGLGLREAKAVIDAELAQPGSVVQPGSAGQRALSVAQARRGAPPHLAPGEQPRRSASWVWILVAGVLLLAWFGVFR